MNQQKLEIENKLKEAGPLDRKREKALKNIDKNAFLDDLMKGTENIDNIDDIKDEKSGKSKNKNKV